MKSRIVLTLLLYTVACQANAECVEGAQTKTGFSRLNSHTVALTGGYGAAIVIRTPCKIKRNSGVSILKDSFCNSDEAVLFIDGNECSAEKVSLDDKFNEDRSGSDYNWDYDVN